MKKLPWYRKIGYFNNPFSIKPASFHDSLFGVDDKVDEIIKSIKAGQCCFIAGEYGSGKTSALKRIIHQFKNKGKVIYYSFSLSSKSLDINKLLVGRSGFFRRLFGIMATDVILLLDEVSDMTVKDSRQIKEYYDEGHFKSIVFVGKDLDNSVPTIVKNMVRSNIYTFKGLSDSDAVQLVRKRIGKLQMISDDTIIKVNKKSNNPRDLLKNMEDVFRHAVESKKPAVDDQSIASVLK
ncbi:MAG: hypothetical protein ABIC04_06555 [Nanoarchaeota archaeon]